MHTIEVYFELRRSIISIRPQRLAQTKNKERRRGGGSGAKEGVIGYSGMQGRGGTTVTGEKGPGSRVGPTEFGLTSEQEL